MPQETYTSLPPTVDELIDMLDQTIPDRCVRPGESHDDHLRYAGRRSLVDDLIAWRETDFEISLKKVS